MNNSRKLNNFKGHKLRFLRNLRGETLESLDKKSNVRSQKISRIELNECVPSFDEIRSLSNALQVSPLFLLNDDQIPTTGGAIFYRKLQRTPKKDFERAELKTRIFALLDQKLSEKLHLSYQDYISFANHDEIFNMLDDEYIENMALCVRSQFKLGDGPISNMTLLIERLGIRVLFADFSNEHIDALTVKINDHFYIAVNSKNISSVRMRFNLAHELGHVLLHSYYSEQEVKKSSVRKVIEAEANYFAGALLMPVKGLALDMIAVNMSYIKKLKKHWKASIQAIVYRGEQINLITSQQALFLRQTIARNSWRKKEPYDNEIPIEYPSFLKSALRYKGDNQLPQKIQEEVGIHDDFFDGLSFSDLNLGKGSLMLLNSRR